MEFFIEIILQIALEVLVQFFGELLVEFGLQIRSKNASPVKNPVLAAFGYLLCGAIIGGISLIFFPHAVLDNPGIRLANLILTPIAAGLLMTFVGAIRRRKGQSVIRLDTFSYGFVFAFGMALIRFLFATN